MRELTTSQHLVNSRGGQDVNVESRASRPSARISMKRGWVAFQILSPRDIPKPSRYLVGATSVLKHDRSTLTCARRRSQAQESVQQLVHLVHLFCRRRWDFGGFEVDLGGRPDHGGNRQISCRRQGSWEQCRETRQVGCNSGGVYPQIEAPARY